MTSNLLESKIVSVKVQETFYVIWDSKRMASYRRCNFQWCLIFKQNSKSLIIIIISFTNKSDQNLAHCQKMCQYGQYYNKDHFILQIYRVIPYLNLQIFISVIVKIYKNSHVQSVAIHVQTFILILRPYIQM